VYRHWRLLLKCGVLGTSGRHAATVALRLAFENFLRAVSLPAMGYHLMARRRSGNVLRGMPCANVAWNGIPATWSVN